MIARLINGQALLCATVNMKIIVAIGLRLLPEETGVVEVIPKEAGVFILCFREHENTIGCAEGLL